MSLLRTILTTTRLLPGSYKYLLGNYQEITWQLQDKLPIHYWVITKLFFITTAM